MPTCPPQGQSVPRPAHVSQLREAVCLPGQLCGAAFASVYLHLCPLLQHTHVRRQALVGSWRPHSAPAQPWPGRRPLPGLSALSSTGAGAGTLPESGADLGREEARHLGRWADVTGGPWASRASGGSSELFWSRRESPGHLGLSADWAVLSPCISTDWPHARELKDLLQVRAQSLDFDFGTQILRSFACVQVTLEPGDGP